MASNQDILQEGDEGVTFDFLTFIKSISATVDKNRSGVGSTPSKIVTSTVDLKTEEALESRLNCFYRLIGLPATRKLENLAVNNSEPTAKQLSQYYTLNYFPPTVVSDDANIGDTLSDREGDFAKKRDVLDFVEMVENPLTIKDLKSEEKITTTREVGDENKEIERKIPIFPMIVDASVPVFGLDKRVAPLYHDGDFIISGANRKRLPRPFLESIIYIRTQRFEADMSERINEIVGSIDRFIAPQLSEVDLVRFKSTLGIVNDSNVKFNLIEAEIVGKLIRAISVSAKSYKEVADSAATLKQQVRFTPKPVDTANEASGNSTLTIQGRDTKTSIDERIADINKQITEQNVLLTLLPTNKVLEADTERRLLSGAEGGGNITADIFVSEFTSVVTLNLPRLQRELREAEADKENKLVNFEKIKQNIMYLTGESQGLSIFDVLCTFLALFTVRLDILVALLNESAQDRLRNNKFFSFAPSANNQGVQKDALFGDEDRVGLIQQGLNGNVKVALKVLEAKVKSNFDLAEAFFLDANMAGQNKKR